MKKIVADIFSSVAASAVFLLLFLGLGWNVFVSAGIAVGLFFAGSLLFKPQNRIGKLKLDSLQNGDEARQLMESAAEDMNSMKECIDKITSPELLQDARKVYATGEDILRYLENNPSKITVARRYINYYLDTASGILKKYISFQSTNLQTDEMKRVFDQTHKALLILDSAFKQQFEKLMQNEIMDIETDIDVLESTLNMENLK